MELVNEKMTNLANAIRSKTGETDNLTIDEMTNAVNNIETGSLKDSYDAMWLEILERKTSFQYAFYQWQMEYMRPPKKIVPTNQSSGNHTFRDNDKLKIIEKDYFDFSQKAEGTASNNSYYYTFCSCAQLEIIEDIGIGAGDPLWALVYTFSVCSKLHTIEKITVAETTTYSGTFNNCWKLANITFEGIIGQSGLDFGWSPLTKTSIENIINHLSTTASGKSITFNKDSINTAFGINVDDISTYPEGSEFYELRHSKDNWTFNYTTH